METGNFSDKAEMCAAVLYCERGEGGLSQRCAMLAGFLLLEDLLKLGPDSTDRVQSKCIDSLSE